ncbi:MAG TPA: hypothetical protein VIT23_05740, partial [Terrimicrobiaceae bacterium]
KTQESIDRLEGAPATLPPEAPEGNLPEPEKEKPLPEISFTPAVVSPKPASPSKRVSREPVRSSAHINDEPIGRGVSPPDRELRELRRELAQARSENKELNERLLKKSAELQSAFLEVDKTKVSVVELKSQLAQSTASLEGLKKNAASASEIRTGVEKEYAGISQQLTEVETENEVLQEENQRLFVKLEKAAKYIAESDAIRANLLTERKQLSEDRNKALAKVKKIKDNAAEIERVTKENRRLKTELTDISEKTVSKSEFEKLAAEKNVLTRTLAESVPRAALVEKDTAIAALKADLNTANGKMLEAQTTITRGDDQLDLLRKQLDETSGRLARVELNPLEEKKLTLENELLRGIILRQIREQTKRDDAKRYIEQELGTLQLNSAVVRQQLAVLGAPVLQLSAEERSLFKEPAVMLTESSPQELEVTVVVSKPSTEEAKPKAEEAKVAAEESKVAAEEAKLIAQESKVIAEEAKIAEEEVKVITEDSKLTAEEAKASKLLQDPIGSEPVSEDVRELVQQAKKKFELKDYIEAEKFYREIVEKLPNSYFALFNLGAVQIEGGKPSAAEVALKKAIEINETESYAYTN